MSDICIKHPEYCIRGRKFETSQSFGSSRIHKSDLRNTTRRFGIVEEPEVVPRAPSAPIRRFGVRERPVPRAPDPEVPVVPVPRAPFGKHQRRPKEDQPPVILRGLSKKYNKKLAEFKKNQLKNLDLGLEESLESLEQHKYARLAQGAYDQSFKSKAKAMKGLRETGKYIPELNDFQIVPEFSNRNFTAYRNPVTGERHLAVRGSDMDFWKPDANIESAFRGKGGRFQNFKDWVTNAQFVIGKHQSSERYREGKNLLKSFAEAEGLSPKEITLSGHSLGGGLAKYLSRVYGNKAFVYNAASNPIKGLKGDLKIKDFHPDSFVKSYRTYGDGVSLGEVVGNKEPQLEVISHTSMPGHENDLLGQHSLEDQFLPKAEDVKVITPEISETTGLLSEPKVSLNRTTKLRNSTALAGGTAAEKGLKNALLAIPAVALSPHYDDKNERHYRNTEMAIDLAKGAFEMEGAEILKAGEGGLPLNESGTFLDLWIGDLIHGADEQEEGSMANKYHKFMKSIREPIFGKDPEVEDRFVAAPTAIQQFNKLTKNLFGNSRYDADLQKQKIQDLADAYGITYSEALELTPETDMGVPLTEGEEWAERLVEAAPERDHSPEVDFERELKPYEWRDPETGQIWIDDELYEDYKREQAGWARWEQSQQEIREAEQYASYQPTFSQSRRSPLEVSEGQF